MNTLPLIVAAVMSMPQGRPETHTLGKTPQQVVSMGREAWFQFYTGKMGDSTMAMADAERTYGTCLAFITGEKIAKLPEDKQSEYRQLRDLMRESAFKAEECGRAMTGGGSLWIIVGAGQGVDAEEVIADVVSMPRKPKAASQAEFWKKAESTRKVIEANRDEISAMAGENGLKAEEVLSRFESLKSDFAAAVKIITPWPPAQRARVIHYFVDTVDMIQSHM